MLPRIRWRSLRTKVITWSFVPTAIILVAVAVVTFTAYQRVTEELVLQRDQDVTRLSAGQLATDLAEHTDLLAGLARTADIYRGEPAAQRAALKRASNALAVFDGGVVLLDTFGTVVAAEPERPEDLRQDWSNRACYSGMIRPQTLGSLRAAFSNIVADGPGGAEVVCISLPVTGEQGELLGAIVGMFRLGATAVSTFYGDIVKLRLGNGGDIYLVDGDGRAIYHSDPSYIGEDFSSQAVVERALTGQVDAIRTRDREGLDIVASYAPVPGTPWSLVVEESWATLTSGSRQYGQFLLLLLALGVAVPILVLVVGVRQITRPITELVDAAQQVARGNFGQKIAASTGDELEEMAEQFNLMSAQLAESYAHLEQRVTDRTRELAALNAIATTVSQSPDLDEILHDALDKTLEVMEIEAGGIYLLDVETGMLTIAAHRGFSPRIVDGVNELRLGEGFSGRVAQSGQPMIVQDASIDSRLTRMVVREEGLRSLAIAPLSCKGRVLGTLFAQARGYREFTEQDVELLTSIGHQIGVAIENVRFFEAEQRRAEQFRVIGEVGRQITSILDIDELLGQIVHSLKETFGYYLITIGLIEGDELVFKAGVKTGWDEPQFLPPSIPVGGRGITAWVAATGEPILAPDVSQEPRFLFLADVAETRSELTVPLKTKSGIIGVLNVESDQVNTFDESDLGVLQSLANQAAIAIENARNYERAQQLAVMEERGRLARDLHDAVTQTLFSSSLIAEVLPTLWESDPEEGRQLLKKLWQLSRGALAEMRALLLELRPAALVEASLGDLLRQLGEAATGRTGVPVTVTVEGRPELPTDVHVGLYRIAQEALNNVVKHADASQVKVSLHHFSPSPAGKVPAGGGKGKSTVELRIIDDGSGFDPGQIPTDRLGLGIMHERAQAIGATLEVESQIGGGTQVTVLWKADERSDVSDEGARQ